MARGQPRERVRVHVRRGDLVEVVAGREASRRGRVLRVDTETGRLLVEKINLVKRHTKPTQKNPQGGIIEKEGSLHSSNVRLVCPRCDQPRRVGPKIESNGKRTRFCRKCKEPMATA
jgi:large subunit ribosomal protein L24